MTRVVDRQPKRRRRDERGLVFVYFVLCLTVLMIASAFSVDVGAWYARKQQLQRAADAAALAGVVWMPGDFARAQTTALATAKANGIDPTTDPNVSVTVSPVPASDRQLKVDITDARAKQYFSQTFMNGFSQHASAVGEYLAPVPLGSPENSLGNADPNCDSGVKTCKLPPNFVLAINGYCASTEDGDPVAGGFDFNKDALNHTVCSSATSPAVKNQRWSTTGYTYDIDVPPNISTYSYKVDIYDGAYWDAALTAGVCKDSLGNTVKDPVTGKNVTPIDTPTQSGGQAPTVTTNWRLLGPDSTPYNNSDNPVLASGTMPSGDCVNWWGWRTLYTLPAGSSSGTYKIQISTPKTDLTSWGMNAFALRADSTQNAAFNPCLSNTTTCASVHGEAMMSIDVFSSTNTATIFLAQIDPAYAGKTMEITVFDPDEGAKSIELDKPDKAKASNFTWTTTDDNCPSLGTLSGGPVNPLTIPLSTCSMTGHAGTGALNDRSVLIRETLPDANTLTKSGDGVIGWWRIKYAMNGNDLSDRTTWSVRVLASPVHLVNNP